MMKRAGAALLAVVFCSSCASTATLQGLGSTTADSAWSELQRIAAATEVIESYSKLILTSPRRQTVNARTAVDRQGRFHAELLTPIGTTAATLFADRDNVLFLNDLERTYWRGTHQQLIASSPRVAPLFAIGQQTSRLMYGLPLVTPAIRKCETESPEQKCFRDDASRYMVEAGGLRSAEANGASFEFDPPAFPAHKVTVTLQGQSLSIEHLDMQTRRGLVKMPAVPAGYQCCSVPSLDVKER